MFCSIRTAGTKHQKPDVRQKELLLLLQQRIRKTGTASSTNAQRRR